MDARETDRDPLDGDPRVAAFFGASFDAVAAFAALLREKGIERGLLGPREGGRLWERHILNSAAVAPFVGSGRLADVGSGAGLPGLVLAAMDPDRETILIEPMERRVAWLTEARAALGLENVEIVRGRAEQVGGDVRARTVTARAVSSVSDLVSWCAPLVNPGGTMALLKGRSAEDEIAAAARVLSRTGFEAEVVEAPTIAGIAATRVVRVYRRDGLEREPQTG